MAIIDELIKIDMLDTISLADLEPILSTAPFCKLDGGFNARDLSDGTHANLKQGYAWNPRKSHPDRSRRTAQAGSYHRVRSRVHGTTFPFILRLHECKSYVETSKRNM